MRKARRRFAAALFVLGAGAGLDVTAGPAVPAAAVAVVPAATAILPALTSGVTVYPERTFEAGSLIIPMDECHQYAGSTDWSTSRTAPKCYCPNATSDDGVIKAYGLMYRLLEHGITVSVAIDDAKTAINGVDFAVTGAEPVKRYDRATNTSTSFFKRGLTCADPSSTAPNVKIDYRGAPFIIPAADAPAALALIKDGSASGTGGTPNRGVFAATTFSTVDVHVAQVAFTAKVARTYRGAPKPVALLNLDSGGGGGGNSGYTVLVNYLTAAGLNTTGAGGTACSPGTIYGSFSSNSDFLSDCLVTGDYATLWAPHWEADGNTQLAQILDKIAAFVDSGKALFGECAAVETFEGAFDQPTSASTGVSVSSASWSGSSKKVTVSGSTRPNTTVYLRSSKNATTCGAGIIATVTSSSTGSWSWTSGAYASAAAAPCRIAADSNGTTASRNVSSNSCSPSSSYVCTGTSTQAAASCGTPEHDTRASGHYLATNGIIRNAIESGWGWGGGSAYGTNPATDDQGFVYRDVANIYLQKGDLKYIGVSGHIRNWKTAAEPRCTPTTNTTGGVAGDSVYKDISPVRLISSCDGSDFDETTGQCLRTSTDSAAAFTDIDSEADFFTYVPHKDGDEAKGPIIYIGGHDYNGTPAGVRLVLNTVFNLQYEVEPEDPPVPYQVVRSAPIVGPVSGTTTYLQGSFTRYQPDETAQTFDAANPDDFVFPYRAGHLYGFAAADISTTSTAYQDLGAPDFDAANGVPTATVGGCTHTFDSSCRTVFTTTAGGAAPSRVLFDTAHRSSIGSLLGGSLANADQEVLIGKVLVGRTDVNGSAISALGGVDRSTLALVEASPQAGGARPTMIYVGGLDGMLHAICASTTSPCDAIGRELWAYVPRTQLGQLRQNTQRIEGSPKVADFLANFDGQGGAEWRTLLVFQTGSGNPADTTAAPSVIAMDITDPGNPAVLWETSTPATRGTTDQGRGLDVALGPVRIGTETRPAVFVSTNNGGTGTAGVWVNALSAVNGAALWTAPFTATYPAPRTNGNPSVPASGLPGGVALYDQGNTGAINRIAVPTLYGDLWVVDAATGQSAYGSNPVFRFSTDMHPIGAAPALYKSSAGAFFAVVASGGYVDDDGATWSSGQQYVVAVKLDVPSDAVPIDETGTSGPNRPFVVEISGDAYAQPTIAGGELFVVTSTTDINDLDAADGAGTLYRVNLATGVSTTYALGSSGGSSVDFAGGVAYVSGLTEAMKIDVSGDFVSAGQSAELAPATRARRRFWLSD